MIMRLGEDRPPPRDLSFWEHHLPWPLLTFPQIVPEINSEPYLVVGRERAFVCLRGVDGASVHDNGDNGIAVTDVGRQLWFGRAGNSSRDTGPPRVAKQRGMPNAGVIDSESRSG